MINNTGNLRNVLIYDCIEPMCRASEHVVYSLPFLCMTSRKEEDEEKKKKKRMKKKKKKKRKKKKKKKTKRRRRISTMRKAG